MAGPGATHLLLRGRGLPLGGGNLGQVVRRLGHEQLHDTFRAGRVVVDATRHHGRQRDAAETTAR